MRQVCYAYFFGFCSCGMNACVAKFCKDKYFGWESPTHPYWEAIHVICDIGVSIRLRLFSILDSLSMLFREASSCT